MSINIYIKHQDSICPVIIVIDGIGSGEQRFLTVWFSAQGLDIIYPYIYTPYSASELRVQDDWDIEHQLGIYKNKP